MPNKKLEIMETRRILRLHQSVKRKRFIAEYLDISRNTVTKHLDFFNVWYSVGKLSNIGCLGSVINHIFGAIPIKMIPRYTVR